MLLRSLLPVFVLLASLSAASVHAQVHRCVDEQGRISFSDTVCNGTRAQKVFGANASARPWQAEDYRPLRMVQTGAGAAMPAGGRPSALSTPRR